MKIPPPFEFCPNCKSNDIFFDGFKKFLCNTCGYEYYHNTAAAVAAFLEVEGTILTIERNRDPGKGMLDLPGGFCDHLESAEEALLRELKEELDTVPTQLEYLFSYPNKYSYKNIEYYTTDFFFYSKLANINFEIDREEIKHLHYYPVQELNPDKFCFASMKQAVSEFKRIKKTG